MLGALEAAGAPLPLREIAAAAGMPPSKAHLYLVSFTCEGVVRQHPETGHYGLGRFAVQLGLSAIRPLDVVALSREPLAARQQATGFAAYLSLAGGPAAGPVRRIGSGPGRQVARAGPGRCAQPGVELLPEPRVPRCR